jgi:hypothetical protein
MSEMLTFFDPRPAGPVNAVVELFDPPMCCPTGICGPAIDQSLLDVNDMILNLQGAGVRVERYQMTSSPQAFLNNPDVMRLVREQEMAALPITAVNGRVIKSGVYPTLVEVQSALHGALG